MATAVHDRNESPFLSPAPVVSITNAFVRPFDNVVAAARTCYSGRGIVTDEQVLGGADAIVLAPLVDAVVMVVAEGSTSIHDVKRALELLPRENFLGFVLNRQKAPMLNYYYAYKATT